MPTNEKHEGKPNPIQIKVTARKGKIIGRMPRLTSTGSAKVEIILEGGETFTILASGDVIFIKTEDGADIAVAPIGHDEIAITQGQFL